LLPTLSIAGQIHGLNFPTTDRVQLDEGIKRSDLVKAPLLLLLMPDEAESRRFLGWTKGTVIKSKPSSITSFNKEGRFGTQLISIPSTNVRSFIAAIAGYSSVRILRTIIPQNPAR
jgi:hypothetical protein